MTMIEKTGFYASIVIIIILLCLIAFSKNGVLDYKMLKQREQVILDQIRLTNLENQRLEKEVQSLKTDMDYLKHVAKHEHEMAEEDELIFKNSSENKGNTP